MAGSPTPRSSGQPPASRRLPLTANVGLPGSSQLPAKGIEMQYVPESRESFVPKSLHAVQQWRSCQAATCAGRHVVAAIGAFGRNRNVANSYIHAAGDVGPVTDWRFAPACCAAQSVRWAPASPALRRSGTNGSLGTKCETTIGALGRRWHAGAMRQTEVELPAHANVLRDIAATQPVPGTQPNPQLKRTCLRQAA